MHVPFPARPIILAVAIFLAPATSAAPVSTAEPGGDTRLLWPDGTPGGERVTAKETLTERLPGGPMRDRFVEHVRRPMVTFFAPSTAYNGVTLLFVPGGGYQRVVIDKEGFESAQWFAARGFRTAVLRYRLPGDGWASGPDAPIHDIRRAVRLLRQERATARDTAARFGVIGFSAGGHATARFITEPALDYARVDAADDLSAHADFAVLMYPVITMGDPSTHSGSQTQLRAAGVPEADLGRYSPDRNVRGDAAPTLLVHAADDATVPVENSLRMYAALRAANVPAELHVFSAGGHGFGMRSIAGKDVEAWPTLVEHWALRDGKRAH
jgi:acetyl esterase/lipase